MNMQDLASIGITPATVVAMLQRGEARGERNYNQGQRVDGQPGQALFILRNQMATCVIAQQKQHAAHKKNPQRKQVSVPRGV